MPEPLFDQCLEILANLKEELKSNASNDLALRIKQGKVLAKIKAEAARGQTQKAYEAAGVSSRVATGLINLGKSEIDFRNVSWLTYAIALELIKNTTPQEAIDEILSGDELTVKEVKEVIKTYQNVKAKAKPTQLELLTKKVNTVRAVMLDPKVRKAIWEMEDAPKVSPKLRRRVLAALHPDKGGDPELFNKIEAIFEEISNK